MANDNPQNLVPVPADNHPAPGVQHVPPAGYMEHDAENGVVVHAWPPTEKETPNAETE